MLINCNPGCAGKKSTTTASLDVSKDEVVCELCGECLKVSPFTKASMKSLGDIVRNNSKKSFKYECLICEKNVETKVVGSSLVGVDCESCDCKFNVSKFSIYARRQIQGDKISDDKD